MYLINFKLNQIKPFIVKYFFLLLLLPFLGCSDFQKVLKADDLSLKNDAAMEYYEQKKFKKASQLFAQLKDGYRTKPQAERIIFFYANCLLETKNYILSAYEFETFIKAYPKSQKVDDAYFLMAYSYYKSSPKFSLDQADTDKALDQIQEFINRYPNSERLRDANSMAEELRLKKEKKGFEIAKQYHTIKDYKASIKSLDNFIADNPGTNFRESALLIQFKSAATLALNSVDYKKLSRLEDSKSKYENFTRLYPESQYLTEAKKIFDQVVEEIVNFANQK